MCPSDDEGDDEPCGVESGEEAQSDELSEPGENESGEEKKVICAGDAGPLKDVLKVESFERTLISVALLTKLVGAVMFTPEAAYAISFHGGRACESRNLGENLGMTQIGKRNKVTNLYEFSFYALKRHCERFAGLMRWIPGTPFNPPPGPIDASVSVAAWYRRAFVNLAGESFQLDVFF